MTMIDNARKFIKLYPENSQPCSFFITGGGFGLLDIGKVTGASKVLADAYIAYHRLEEISVLRTVLGDEINQLLNGEIGFVSPWTTYQYAMAMMARHKNTLPDATICVVNASLTTTRWRKGNNEAFYAVVNRPTDNKDGKIRMFKLSLNKLKPEMYNDINVHIEQEINYRRLLEDEKVSLAAMGMIIKDTSFFQLEDDEIFHPIQINGDPKDPKSFQPQLQEIE